MHLQLIYSNVGLISALHHLMMRVFCLRFFLYYCFFPNLCCCFHYLFMRLLFQRSYSPCWISSGEFKSIDIDGLVTRTNWFRLAFKYPAMWKKEAPIRDWGIKWKGELETSCLLLLIGDFDSRAFNIYTCIYIYVYDLCLYICICCVLLYGYIYLYEI